MRTATADIPARMKDFLDNFYNMDVFGGTLASDQAFQASLNIAATASATAAVACIPTWETDFRDDLAGIDVPMLVVQGDADRVLPYPSTGKRLPGLIKDMQLVVIEGGPHYCLDPRRPGQPRATRLPHRLARIFAGQGVGKVVLG
jgi:non-heme chloroperoxidase